MMSWSGMSLSDGDSLAYDVLSAGVPEGNIYKIQNSCL